MTIRATSNRKSAGRKRLLSLSHPKPLNLIIPSNPSSSDNGKPRKANCLNGPRKTSGRTPNPTTSDAHANAHNPGPRSAGFSLRRTSMATADRVKLDSNTTSRVGKSRYSRKFCSKPKPPPSRDDVSATIDAAYHRTL